jgi:hypothetical protein
MTTTHDEPHDDPRHRIDAGGHDWRTMEAGRELDALIAARIGGYPAGHPEQPHYSTDAGAALDFVYAVRATHPQPHLALHLTEEPTGRASVALMARRQTDAEWSDATGRYAVPLAICRAALAALEASHG